MNIGVIGLGLMGGSVTKAFLNKRDKDDKIYAIDTSPVARELAMRAGVDGAYASINAWHSARPSAFDDLVIVIATPMRASFVVLTELGLILKDNRNIVITDMAGAKAQMLVYARQALGGLAKYFVGAHPLIATDKSGFSDASAELLQGQKVLICPDPLTTPKTLLNAMDFWRKLGMYCVKMGALTHDQTLAKTSHLPHLLSFCLMHQLEVDDGNYAAAALGDFSRGAGSSALLWHDVFLDNHAAIIASIDEYIEKLNHVKRLLQNEQSGQLLQWLKYANRTQAGINEALARTPAPDVVDVPEPLALSDFEVQEAEQDFSLLDSELEEMAVFHILPARQIEGKIRVSGDKSISHRAVMLGALAHGTTTIGGILMSEDVSATINAFNQMGVNTTLEGERLSIDGVGLHGLNAPDEPLNLGNSGTAMRLLMGILSAQRFESVLCGDKSLSARPMGRVHEPLMFMGAKINLTGDTAPIHIDGTALRAIEYRLPMPSAQIKSAILLAGLYARGRTIIHEPKPSRNHTELMLRSFGYEVERDKKTISLSGGGDLKACHIDVPADISSAAFFMVAAAISEKGKIVLTDVGINPTRTGILQILQMMGANIKLNNKRDMGHEMVADVTVQASHLQGITVPPNLVSLAIDEFPIIFIAAACATGTTTITGASELRVKECDRISVMADGLTKLGVNCQVLDDGIIIQGLGERGQFNGAMLDSGHDHRVAMSFAVASLRASAPIVVLNAQTVTTSFPDFERIANRVGMNIRCVGSEFYI